VRAAAGAEAPPLSPPPASGASPGRRLDLWEAAALAALLILAIAPLAGLLVRVWTQGGVVTGGDGFLVADPLQYLNWLRQHGEHGAARNLYDIAPSSHVFVHPGLLISGLLYRLGLGVAAAYFVWKPVAVAALFAGTLLYVRRFLQRPGDRRLALILALFTCSPVAAIVGWGGIGDERTKFDFDFISGELWPGSWLWGYLFTVIAVALMPLGVLAYERGRDGGRRARLGWAAAAGLLCCWLQPWQGATFAGILVGAEAIAVLRGRRPVLGAARDLAVPVVATALPALYYWLLSRYEDAWALARVANDLPRWPWWVTVLGLAPLAIPALLAYRDPARDFGDVALRVWPLAGLVVYYLPFGTFPFHAFQGLALPLVVLGVLAVRHRLGTRPIPAWAAVAVCLVLIVPGTAYRVDQMAGAVERGYQPFFLTAEERDALRALEDDPEPGGVLAPIHMGMLLPAYTGRETWVGAGSWSPQFDQRTQEAEALFQGGLDRAAAEALVRRSGARFLLSDCRGRVNIDRIVAGFTDPPRRFGCATIYRVSDR
jgi:hypothetical protein